MLDDGLIDPLPDAAFALHVMPNAPHGLFSGRAGPLLASSDKLYVTITGRGGHASMPHDTRDPIPVACEIVTAIQAMVARRVSVFDPAVVSISKISAGTTDNIVPETAELLGTIRTHSAHRRAAVAEDLRHMIPRLAEAHGCTAEVKIVEGFPVTVCDAGAVAFGQRVAADLFGADSWVTLQHPIMGAEDFAYVLEKVPGAMFFLGASHEGDDWRSCCGLHSNRMVLDDGVMARGAALHAALAERYLAGGLDG
jgi:hippurate hydrolase